MEAYEDVVTHVNAADHRCSQAAWTELLDECELQFGQLQQLQDRISLTESEDCGHTPREELDYAGALTAELQHWLKVEPKLLSENQEVLLSAGTDEVTELNTQLEMVLSCAYSKRDKLKDTLKSEQKWLEEKKEVLKAATEQVAKSQQENSRISETSVLQEMKKKIQLVKDYQDTLLETLSDLLAEHFPLPQHDGNISKKKKTVQPEPREDLISLHDILELLMNKIVETPHDPYMPIDDTFWPPYIETLLRYGIASRHPDDCFKIRLEDY